MSQSAASNNIKVSVRVRPLNEREKRAGEARGDGEYWSLDGSAVWSAKETTSTGAPLKFTFDSVFGPGETNMDVYERMARPIVHSSMDGFNGTIFAYGQTSSGKTHTMAGTAENPGVTPLAVREVFDIIDEQKDREFLLRVSYMEIYNEKITDLLNPKGRNGNLKIHEDARRGVFVGNLTEEIVLCPEDIFALLARGAAQRHVGATNMNEFSSRSHSIFKMVIESREKLGGGKGVGAVRVSSLNLVDLAGSEKVANTGAQGVRLKEAGNINKSLLTLGTVIHKLSEGTSSHIPYRDSKLTRILQSALGGNALTAVVATITPSIMHTDETLSTLKFATRAKTITNHAELNEVVDEQTLLRRYKQEINDLKDQLDGNALQEKVLLMEREKAAIAEDHAALQAALQDKEAKESAMKEKIKFLKHLFLTAGRKGAGDDDDDVDPLDIANDFEKPTAVTLRRETWAPGKAERVGMPTLTPQKPVGRRDLNPALPGSPMAPNSRIKAWQDRDSTGSEDSTPTPTEEMRDRIAELTDLLETAREQQEAAEADVALLEEKLAASESGSAGASATETAMLKAELDEKREELLDASRTKVMLEATIAKLEEEKTVLESQVAELEAMAKEMEAKAGEAEEMETKMKKMEWDQEMAMNGLQEEISQLKMDVSRASVEKTKLEEDLLAKGAAASAKDLEHNKAMQAAEKDFAAQLAELQEKLEAAEEAAEEAKASAAEAEEKAAEEKTRADEAEARIAELETELDEAKIAAEAQEETLAGVRTEVDSLETELDTARAEIKHLSGTGVGKEMASQQREKEKLQTKLAEEKDKLKLAVKEKQAAVSEKAAAERELKAVNKKMTLVERENEKLKNGSLTNKELTAQITALEKKLDAANKSLDKYKSQATEHDTAQSAVKERLAQAKADKEELEKEKEELTAALEEAKTNMEEAVEKAAAIEAQLESAQATQEELEAASEALTAAEADLGEFREVREKLEAELAEAQAELETARARIGELEASEAKLSEANDAVNEQLVELNFGLGEAKQEAEEGAKAAKELAEVREELEQAQAASEQKDDYIQQLAEEGIKAQEKVDELEAEVDSLTSKLDELQEAAANLKGHVSESDGRVTLMKSRVMDLESLSSKFNDDAKRSVAAMRRELDRSAKDVEHYLEQIGERDSEIGMLKKELHARETELRKAQDALKALKLSHGSGNYLAEAKELKLKLQHLQYRMSEKGREAEYAVQQEKVNLEIELQHSNERRKAAEGRAHRVGNDLQRIRSELLRTEKQVRELETRLAAETARRRLAEGDKYRSKLELNSLKVKQVEADAQAAQEIDGSENAPAGGPLADITPEAFVAKNKNVTRAMASKAAEHAPAAAPLNEASNGAAQCPQM